MKYNTILLIGSGQIGKAILNKIVLNNPKKIIIHNLTEKESTLVCNKYSSKYPDIKFISSFGNIFMPYILKDLNNKNLYSKSEDIIEYFYKEINNDVLENSTIVTLIRKYKPDVIVDAINTATVLGNPYNPESILKILNDNPIECSKKIMVDDYTTKIINFVYSLKYGLQNYNVKKYIKVSTTGLGGMGLDMPYTHGDNPKFNLSNALMGKIAASGVLHQLLWNLEHTKGLDISLIIPGTFVGYDSVLNEAIETDKGLLYKRKKPEQYNLVLGKELKYNQTITKDYLSFPVVRAGENHVYSQLELETLTAIGQMEGITKEEVANKVMECLEKSSNNDILSSLDNAMLKPSYLGREMLLDIDKQFTNIKSKYGIVRRNISVAKSKQLYELFLIKKSYPLITDLKKVKIDTLVEKVNNSLDNDLIEEIITLGIPIINNKNEIYIGDYSLIPSADESKIITKTKLKNWTDIGWVDLRKENLDKWIKILIDVYENANKISMDFDKSIYLNCQKINNDYNIAEYLAYYNNLKNKGRKK